MTTDKRVAILGAGAGGACAALELASRGFQVTLFERNSEAVAEASLVNEGKIHLGFIYAMDRSLRTARKMIDGALVFEDHLRRWVDFRAADAVSTPFLYGIHRDSLMGLEQLLAHYAACADYYRQRAAELGRDYLGMGTGFRFHPVPEAEYPADLNPEFIPQLVATTEYAVDPRHVARCLRRGLQTAEGIEFRPGHTVTAIDPLKGNGYRVTVQHDGQERSESFPQVVNATWYRRLPLDRPLGIEPPGPWSHRYKFGNRVAVSLTRAQLPSITCVQGPFGDLVNFEANGFFLSWYPTGRTGMSLAESPPEWDAGYDRAQRMAVFHNSLGHWKQRCARLDELRFSDEDVDPVGGVIYALGTEDVDHVATRLHDRYDIGLQSRGGYHSVDTGKYTLAPLMGMAVADRVSGVA